MRTSNNNIDPPSGAKWLLNRYCNSDLHEEIEGDLNEEFNTNINENRIWFARLKYFFGVLHFLRKSIFMKRRYLRISNSLIKNYIKIAYRNILRSKAFTALNVLGLSLSMTICLLIILFTLEQSRMDNFHQKRNKMYRVLTENAGFGRPMASVSPAMPSLLENFEFVESAVNLKTISGTLVSNQQSADFHGLYAESDFFDLFSYNVIHGNPKTCLINPLSIVVNETVAKRFFYTSENIIGKEFSIETWPDKSETFTITAVIEDQSHQSHLKFDVLMSFSTIVDDIENEKFNFGNYYTYFSIHDKSDEIMLPSALESIRRSNYSDSENISPSFRSQALSDIPLAGLIANEPNEFPSRKKLKNLIRIGTILMIIACFNFVGLSIAAATKRAKEIGVRKVTGAGRLQLVTQFLTESMIISLIALIISIILLQLLIPVYNSMESTQYSHAQIQTTLIKDFTVYLLFFGFSILIGLVGGLYPAIYMSALKPVRILKGSSLFKPARKITLRKILVTLQLIFTSFIITATLVEYKQFKYMTDVDYGFDNENIINIPLQKVNYNAFRQSLLENTAIIDISASSKLMVVDGTSKILIRKDSATGINASNFEIDNHFIENLGLSIIAGRNFHKDQPELKNSIIINQSAASALGYENPYEIIGQGVVIETNEFQIIGVIKDFHHGRIDRISINDPLVFFKGDQFNYINVKVDGENITQVLAAIEAKWKKFDIIHPLEYSFFDRALVQRFRRQSEGIKTMGFATFITISIACFGLLGMSIYNTEIRAKEVGIRKVLGSSTFSIFALLNKEYWKLIGIALLIAMPLAIFFSRMSLQRYPYKVTLGAEVFLLAIFTVVAICILTVSSQTFRAATSNPIKSISEE